MNPARPQKIAPPASRRRRPTRLVSVQSVESLSPHLTRIVFGGKGLAGFEAGEFTDHYVKLQFPPVGAPYTAPFDVEAIRAELPAQQWPRTRTYTVRAWDSRSRLLTIDFVVHGDTGVAGPWAVAARPGDLLQLTGPGGAYALDPGADWHLMIGDLSVLPAISASLPRVPGGRPVHVVLQVRAEDEVTLDSPGELTVHWVHDLGEEALIEALAQLAFPAGSVDVFLHGEAASVRAARRYLIVDCGVSPKALSASGYWKRARTEEGWREDKADWARQVEADATGAEPAAGR